MAEALARLAVNNPDNQAQIAKKLVGLLGASRAGAQQRAAHALWELSANNPGAPVIIVNAGAISPLVALLESLSGERLRGINRRPASNPFAVLENFQACLHFLERAGVRLVSSIEPKALQLGAPSHAHELMTPLPVMWWRNVHYLSDGISPM